VTLLLIVPVMLLATVLLTRFALAPLVDELNRLMEKLRAAQAAERRFFSDAAHEAPDPCGGTACADTLTRNRTGHAIKIRLSRYPHAVWITVADNGPGIPVEYRACASAGWRSG
jgi:signal transduction histidine kinase